MLKDHHEGYIEWAEFERNQALLAANTFGRAGGVKSGRGGRALLAGLLTCGRCGRRLPVVYTGKTPRPTYRCDRPNLMLGLKRCLIFGGARVEAAVASELIRAVEPMAIEAALEAERIYMDSHNERRRIVELELQQAQYEASLAERRYAACDPDNRLIAAQLEKSWEAALRRVEACQTRLDAGQQPDKIAAGSGADAVIAPEMLAFARTLGFQFRAHRVGHPDRKGRIERPFAYVENNFLAARDFADFDDLNRQALAWCRDVANHKPKQVLGMSAEAACVIEKPHLRQLPDVLPPVYDLLERLVDLHGYVSVDTNRCSVPERFVGQSVAVYKLPAEIHVCRKGVTIAVHPG